MSYEYARNLAPEAFQRYKQKISICGLECCPYQLVFQDLTEDPRQWPDVTHGDIWEYLVNSPGVFTQQTMRNFKSLEAYRFFQSGWVRTVYHRVYDDTILFRAEVTPSYRVNEEPHYPWIVLKLDGAVSVTC